MRRVGDEHCSVAGRLRLRFFIVASAVFAADAASTDLSRQCERAAQFCQSEQSHYVSGHAAQAAKARDPAGHSESATGVAHPEHQGARDQAAEAAHDHSAEGAGAHDGLATHAGHDGHAPADAAEGGGLLGHKLAGLGCIIASAVAGIVLRLRSPTTEHPQLLGYINVLSGSMFIAMGLFHILPEALEHQPEQMASLMTGERSGLAVMVCVFAGFTLVLSLERVLFDAHASSEEEAEEQKVEEELLREVLNPKVAFLARVKSKETVEQPVGLSCAVARVNSNGSQQSSARRPSLRRRLSMASLAHLKADAGAPPDFPRAEGARDCERVSPPVAAEDSLYAESEGSLQGAPGAAGARCCPQLLGALCGAPLAAPAARRPAAYRAGPPAPRAAPRAEGCARARAQLSQEPCWPGLGPPAGPGPGAPAGAPGGPGLDVSALVLMTVLSVHALFEGVVIGTASSTTATWVLVAVVVAHKWASAFAVTNHLAGQQEVNITVCALLTIFVMASPVGILLGLVVSDLLAGIGPACIKTALNAMGVGTLLYIGMTEVVPEEFTGARFALRKLCVFLVAAVVNLILTWVHLVTGHPAHGRGHDHGHAGEGSADLPGSLQDFCGRVAKHCEGLSAGG